MNRAQYLSDRSIHVIRVRNRGQQKIGYPTRDLIRVLGKGHRHFTSSPLTDGDKIDSSTWFYTLNSHTKTISKNFRANNISRIGNMKIKKLDNRFTAYKRGAATHMIAVPAQNMKTAKTLYEIMERSYGPPPQGRLRCQMSIESSL